MYDTIEIPAREQGFHAFPVGEIRAHHAEAVEVGKARGPCLFQGHIIVVVEVVEPDDFVTTL